jgi:hypothetical protein
VKYFYCLIGHASRFGGWVAGQVAYGYERGRWGYCPPFAKPDSVKRRRRRQIDWRRFADFLSGLSLKQFWSEVRALPQRRVCSRIMAKPCCGWSEKEQKTVLREVQRVLLGCHRP